MKLKKLLVSALLISCCIISAGCDEIKPDNPNDGKYATQNKESALEYQLYMGKQVQVFINEISTRMAIAKNLSTGKTADNEVALAQAGIDKLQETYDEVITVNPSTGSDEEREAALTAMKTAIDHLKGYKEAVEKGESVDGYVADFENDFNQLTGIASFYNQ
ncbi:MAG: hypothetical protein K6E28_11170 [Eubacterium sp.]|nr:hypothetical protein [Eubacterium sp.]